MTQLDVLTAQARAAIAGLKIDPKAAASRPVAKRTADSLAGRIDHTALKANVTAADVRRLCAEAKEYGFASVCVNTRWVPLAAAELAGSEQMVCTVVSFPLGAMAPEAKAEEARIAVSQGAQEVDMVIDIGDLLSGDLQSAYDDIAGVVRASLPSPVKVILETCLLDDVQKVIACLLSAAAGAAYVKTSTGFSTGGATAADIALMRGVVGDELGVKASGAIRTAEDAATTVAAGADRVGASASIAIIGIESGGSSDY